MFNDIISIINGSLLSGNVLGLLLVAIGFVGVVCEFLRPGLVVPGVLGSLCLVFGFHEIWQHPPGWPLAIGFGLPFLALLGFLLKVAWRARRNKRIAIFLE